MPVSNNYKLIVLEVTNKCNNSCLHCYNYWREGRNEKINNGQLSRLEIRKLIRSIKSEIPLQQVAISGGEPLLRKDLPGIIVDLRLENLSTVIITNGALLSDSLLNKFPEGTVFEITLFSSDSKLHNMMAGRDVFQTVIKNIARIEKHKCSYILSLVITKLNAKDTLSTIELGIALGAEGVLFNRINLSRITYPIADKLVPSIDQLKFALEAAEKAASDYGIAISISVPIPACLVNPEDYPHLHFGWCPRGGSNAYYTISTSGELRPCNHSSLKLGDLKTNSFLDLVRSKASRSYWPSMPDNCKDCSNKFKKVCHGGCPAASQECLQTKRFADPFIDYTFNNK